MPDILQTIFLQYNHVSPAIILAFAYHRPQAYSPSTKRVILILGKISFIRLDSCSNAFLSLSCLITPSIYSSFFRNSPSNGSVYHYPAQEPIPVHKHNTVGSFLRLYAVSGSYHQICSPGTASEYHQWQSDNFSEQNISRTSSAGSNLLIIQSYTPGFRYINHFQYSSKYISMWHAF